MKLTKFRTGSRRMVILGETVEPGSLVSLDSTDPVVRSWMKAHNISLWGAADLR